MKLIDFNLATAFAMTDTKLYFPVVTLSTADNAKLLQQLKSGLKCTINWNKHQSKVTTEVWNRYLDSLIDASFHGVNRYFVLLFENNAHQTLNTNYFLPTIKIKDYNVMIDGKSFFISQ